MRFSEIALWPEMRGRQAGAIWENSVLDSLPADKSKDWVKVNSRRTFFPSCTARARPAAAVSRMSHEAVFAVIELLSIFASLSFRSDPLGRRVRHQPRDEVGHRRVVRARRDEGQGGE